MRNLVMGRVAPQPAKRLRPDLGTGVVKGAALGTRAVKGSDLATETAKGSDLGMGAVKGRAGDNLRARWGAGAVRCPAFFCGVQMIAECYSWTEYQ